MDLKNIQNYHCLDMAASMVLEVVMINVMIDRM